jgi:hypothetical protein
MKNQINLLLYYSNIIFVNFVNLQKEKRREKRKEKREKKKEKMSICKTFLKPFTNLKDSYNHCVKTIISIKRKRQFYIGATAWPKFRVEDHKKSEKKMEHMVLLCQVPTLKMSKEMETKVIKRFVGKKFNINKSEGGEGLVNELNYIYVLFR